MPPEFPTWVLEHRAHLLAFFLCAVAFERLWLLVKKRQRPEPKQLVLNVSMWLVELGIRSALWPIRWFAFVWLAQFRLIAIPTNWTTAVALYVMIDFVYYFRHRWMHESKFGWALHRPHHTSTHFDLLASIRLGWIQRAIDDFFYLPLVLFGFEPHLLLLLILLNEIFPGYCHTEALPKLGVLESFLNTPQHHRLHHEASDDRGSCNYASTFIVWDRLFNTFRAEPTKSKMSYGLQGEPETQNPIRLQFAGLSALFRNFLASSKRKVPKAKIESGVAIANHGKHE